MIRSPIELTRTSVLAALAVGLGILDLYLPRPFLFFKFGLGNLPVLLAIILYSPVSGMFVQLTKILGVSIIGGYIFSPGFILSLGSGLSSFLTMTVCQRYFHNSINIVTISILGAAANCSMQFYLAYSLYIKNPAILVFWPPAMIFSILTGFLLGLIGHRLINRSHHIK